MRHISYAFGWVGGFIFIQLLLAFTIWLGRSFSGLLFGSAFYIANSIGFYPSGVQVLEFLIAMIICLFIIAFFASVITRRS